MLSREDNELVCRDQEPVDDGTDRPGYPSARYSLELFLNRKEPSSTAQHRYQ